MQSDWMLNRLYLLSLLVFVGSVLSVLYSVYYMQQLSVAVGIDSGIIATASVYNITISASSGLIGSLPTLQLALKLSYLLFAFSIGIFAFAVLQVFQGKRSSWNSAILISTVLYAIIAYILETSFDFAEPFQIFSIAVVGSALAFVPALYMLLKTRNRKGSIARNIGLNPLTPYTNIVKLSDQLLSKLRGSLRILDMHFDSTGLKNLSVLLDGNEANYSSVSVLAKGDRIDAKFVKGCRDFKEELQNKGIAFELRVMSPDDSSSQHERIMMDDGHAYKIPPLNIINRKSEHIVRISHAEAMKRFDYLWKRSTKIENL